MLARLGRLLGRQKGDNNQTKERQKGAGLQSQCHTSRNKYFWGKHRTTGKTSTPTSPTEQEQQMNMLDKLTHQLEMMTNERNELQGILASYTNKDLNNRLDFELEMLNMEHKKVMLDLQKFPKEISEALQTCRELTEETVSCSILHSQILNEWTQLKEKVSTLREENRKLRREQISLQESSEEMKMLCGEAHEKIYELLAKEEQKREKLEERLQYLLKQRDLVTKQMIMAEKLQHHLTVSQMRFENLQHELEQTTAQGENLLQMETLQQEH
ncbi:disks large homolog 5-like isoform X1 [Mesocricetus auratus]|uniref:Disks large homolog 5-like isoform X1 n=2 Tax=Mesocricetus auratus TaxID=10036 RepID=A0ABM2X9M9_MESAU|nr:disks large homolog 5-like isoform X1 [Mesocricetus auratus]